MKKIVFDLDGTLLDSRSRHTAVLQKVDDELKTQLGLADNYDFSDYFECKINGVSTYKYLVYFKGFPDEIARKYASKWVELIEKDEFLQQDILYSDSIETLAFLKFQDQYELYLITARANEEGLQKQLNNCGLTQYFNKIYCVSPQFAREEKIEAASNLSDVILWIGDTEVDWQAANAVSAEFYALNRGFRNAAYWNDNGIKSHHDLSFLDRKLREM